MKRKLTGEIWKWEKELLARKSTGEIEITSLGVVPAPKRKQEKTTVKNGHTLVVRLTDLIDTLTITKFSFTCLSPSVLEYHTAYCSYYSTSFEKNDSMGDGRLIIMMCYVRVMFVFQAFILITSIH